jgi:hypothetical protein
VQVPQFKSLPHVSLTGPQSLPRVAHVCGLQVDADAPQTLGVPSPPQVCGAVQVPQLKSPPQPSPAGPQLAPS